VPTARISAPVGVWRTWYSTIHACRTSTPANTSVGGPVDVGDRRLEGSLDRLARVRHQRLAGGADPLRGDPQAALAGLGGEDRERIARRAEDGVRDAQAG
jgi:hypothetical protein